MVFVENWNFFFILLFLVQSSQKRWFIDILDRKEWFFDRKLNVSKSAKKLDISDLLGDNPWFFVEKLNFFSIGFFGIIKSEICFFSILGRNEWFLDQKGNVLRSAKNSTFSFKDSPWFFPKFKLFLISVFEEIVFEKIVSWYSK